MYCATLKLWGFVGKDELIKVEKSRAIMVWKNRNGGNGDEDSLVLMTWRHSERRNLSFSSLVNVGRVFIVYRRLY